MRWLDVATVLLTRCPCLSAHQRDSFSSKHIMPWVLDILGFFVGPKWHRMFPSNCVLAGKRQRCGKITASWHWPPQWHKCCLQQTHLKLAVSRIVVFFHASRRFGAVKHIRKKNALTGGILSTRSCDGVFLRSFLFCGTHGRLLWDVHWVGQTDPCECLWRYIESKFSQRAGFDDMCALRAWRDPCANRNGGMAHTRIYASQITRYANTNNN